MVCQPQTTACKSMAVTCAGVDYCNAGDICCIDATGMSGAGTTSCQTGPTCPSTSSTLLGGEYCQTDSDCQNGAKCLTYDCVGSSVTACAGSLVGSVKGLCGSGSGT